MHVEWIHGGVYIVLAVIAIMGIMVWLDDVWNNWQDKD